MINIIAWLFAGALMGWLATLLIHRRHPILLRNIIVGSVGAFLAGFLLVPLFHIDTTSFSMPGLLISMIGSIVLLLVVNFFVREHNVTNTVLKNQWGKVREKIHVRWGKISEEDCDQIDGNHEQLTNLIVERYGIPSKQAEDQVQSYLGAVVSKASLLPFLHKHVHEVNSSQSLK